jgi:hypothetical protein
MVWIPVPVGWGEDSGGMGVGQFWVDGCNRANIVKIVVDREPR